AGNFAAREIELLGKSGLMTEYGEAFHPSEAINLADLMRAMLGIYQGPEMIRSLSDADAIKQAMAQGWLKEEMPPESTVTRSLMTQVLIRSLGLEYLAEIPEIYQLPYRDANSIAENTRGYAALCWGLGIIRSDGVSFAPQQDITRAEAAAALVNSLRIKR
ncbi:MAG: peptidase, partial [Syntrophomonadaceae bacterium]|nr:peptidase [Syntrophomonadaceae bacterium]